MRVLQSRVGQALPLVVGVFLFVLIFGFSELILAAQVSELGAADKERIFLETDGHVLFDTVEGDIYAEGNVVIKYQGMIIRANEARYVAKEKKVYLVGDVEYEEDEQLIRGTSLIYDFNTKTRVFDAVKYSFSSEGMKGLAYVTGQRVTGTDELMHIDTGTITTCDLDAPHFHLQAKSIEIYPDEKIIVKHVVYYEGKVPLFYWPYLVIPIRKTGDGETPVFEMPRIGYSEETGWYVKSAYNYYRHPESYGKVHVDWFQKRGWGKGVRHTYMDSALGLGSIFVYHLSGNSDWGESTAIEVEQDLTVGGLELGIAASRTQRQTDSDRLVDQFADIDLAGSTGRSRVNGYLDYENSRSKSGGIAELDLAGQIDYSYQLSDQWRVILGGDLRMVDNPSAKSGAEDSIEKEIGYLAELAHRQSKYEAGVKLERRLHSDVFSSSWPTAVDWLAISSTPEVYWRSRNWRWFNGWLPMRFAASFSQLQEEYRSGSGTEAQKLSLLGGTGTKAVTLTPKTRLTFSGWVQYDAYRNIRTLDFDDGMAWSWEPDTMDRVVLSSRTGLHYRPWSPLTLSLGHNYDWVYGDTPFVFDEIDLREEITGRIQYRQGGFTASLSSGYDIASQEHKDVVGRIGYSPNAKLSAAVQVIYDVKTGTFEDVYTLLRTKPRAGWELQVGSSYSVPDGVWERLDARAAAELPWGLSVQYLISYDGVADQLAYNDIAITKDLHCREITLRYSGVAKEIWLEFSLNAFPRTKLLAGSSDDKLLFEAEGIEELIKLVE